MLRKNEAMAHGCGPGRDLLLRAEEEVSGPGGTTSRASQYSPKMRAPRHEQQPRLARHVSRIRPVSMLSPFHERIAADGDSGLLPVVPPADLFGQVLHPRALRGNGFPAPAHSRTYQTHRSVEPSKPGKGTGWHRSAARKTGDGGEVGRPGTRGAATTAPKTKLTSISSSMDRNIRPPVPARHPPCLTQRGPVTGPRRPESPGRDGASPG